MHNIRKITEDLFYIGCSDRRLALFESAYPVPKGVSYNSYLLKDEKTVLFDTVDKSCETQFFKNLEAALGGKSLDYIVVHHMEPDHAALLERVIEKYPEAKIVCTLAAKNMIKQFFDFDIENCSMIVKEGDTLKTGTHEFQFILAPMVHWPEVMLSYDKATKSLFSADAFGSFGAIDGNIFDYNFDLDEARRYYTNIVGKYGLQVQNLLKKVAGLEIKSIYPLHGLIIRENINLFVEKYNQWSSYAAEENGVLIAYSSVYGGTENVVNILAGMLADMGVRNIKIYDLSYSEHSEVLAQAFKYSNIVLATTTYNAGIFESMMDFVHKLVSHNLQNRKFALIENGTWAPVCGSQLQAELEKLKGSEFISPVFSLKSTMKENQIDSLKEIADKIGGTLL